MAELPSPIAAQPAICATPVRPGGDAEAPQESSMDELVRDVGRRMQLPTLDISPMWSIPTSSPTTPASSVDSNVDVSWIMRDDSNRMEQQPEMQDHKQPSCSAECLNIMNEIEVKVNNLVLQGMENERLITAMKDQLREIKDTMDRLEKLMENLLEKKSSDKNIHQE